MNQLISVNAASDIVPEYKSTPIGLLVEYHNLGRLHDDYHAAQVLVGMCMDNRKQLNIPSNFAYIIRSGGANLQYSEFHISYAIAVGGVKFIALIGHNQCGMVNLEARRDLFVQGLVENAGWEKDAAVEQFKRLAPQFEIGNEVEFIVSEAKQLRLRYPKIQVAPLLYRVENDRLYFIREG